MGEKGRLVVILLNNLKRPSEVWYKSNGNDNIYFFNGIKVYSKAISRLLQQAELPPLVYVIYSDISSVLPIMQFLSQFQESKFQEINNKTYIEQYKYHSGDIAVPKIYPLICELIILMDNELIEADPISIESIMIQQLVRFLSLIHGGSFACISQVISKVFEKNVDSLLLMAANQPSANPIFNDQQEISLTIPKGWDSWNKIVLLSKSIYYDIDSSSYVLFTNQSDINHITAVYLQYTDSQIPQDLFLELFKKETADDTSNHNGSLVAYPVLYKDLLQSL